MKLISLCLALLAAGPAIAQAPSTQAPAPVAELVRAVDIPSQRFTLPNGLTVLVHTDRKAPIVNVSMWYHVGSKDEPAGRTGFAHLFEHLMFGGSEHVPNFDEAVIALGGANNNGSTWYDRTNYYATVPSGALDRMLFVEADRMGHLLGAVTQQKLDAQRGVVQNEKRQGDNQPFGTVEYVVNDALFPAGHPYRHATIGSMRDLNAASLDDVRSWFRANYGPNNAVLALAGDIDVATAREKVARYFGAISRGAAVAHPAASVPTLQAPVVRRITDQVPFTRLMRVWPVEGVNGRDVAALDAAASVLGGLSSSRLDNALVRGEQSAVSVTADVQAYERLGLLTVSADVKPGQDADKVGRRLDAVIAEFLADGPSADEVRRVAAREVSNSIAGYEGVAVKAATLAEGQLYSGDPGKFKRDLAETAALTPAQVRDAARRWMRRPGLSLRIDPGPRDQSEAARAVTGDRTMPPTGRGPALYNAEAQPRAAVVEQLPPLGTVDALTFPAIERTRLANGIPVFLARRTAVPAVRVAVSFDAGFAADAKARLGEQALTLALLDEGTTTRNSIQIAEEQERLGAALSSGGSLDRSSVNLFAVKPNLAASLALLADVVRNPAFAEGEVARLRAQQLAGIAAQLSDPGGVTRYVLNPILYGAAHPYGVPATGSGTAATVARLTRADVVRFHHDWFWPGNAQIFVVGDVTLAELKPLLEASFGTWAADRTARPRKAVATAIPAPQPKIYLVDRPGAGQSYIGGGVVLDRTGRDELIPLRQANDVLGGSFVSRLNSDLREAKGWSYGTFANVGNEEGNVTFTVRSPVQTDRTGDALQAIRADIAAFLGPQGISATERTRSVSGAIRELPGMFESSAALLGAVQRIVWLGRPDDYYATLPGRYEALDVAALDRAARAALDPKRFIWVVAGDAKLVRPQLEKVGLPIELLPIPTTN